MLKVTKGLVDKGGIASRTTTFGHRLASKQFLEDFRYSDQLPEGLLIPVNERIMMCMLLTRQVWELGPLGEAILERNELSVLKTLSKDTEHLKEQTRNGQTPIHLAIDWPKGLRLLLAAGGDADVLDSMGVPPIIYACGANNYEAIQILLDSGTSLPPATMNERDVAVAMDRFFNCKFEVIQILFECLKDRRGKLLDLALHCSPIMSSRNTKLPPRKCARCASIIYLLASRV